HPNTALFGSAMKICSIAGRLLRRRRRRWWRRRSCIACGSARGGELLRSRRAAIAATVAAARHSASEGACELDGVAVGGSLVVHGDRIAVHVANDVEADGIRG